MIKGVKFSCEPELIYFDIEKFNQSEEKNKGDFMTEEQRVIYVIPQMKEFSEMYLSQLDNKWKLFGKVFDMRHKTCNISCISMLALFHRIQIIYGEPVDKENIERVMFSDFILNDKYYRELVKQMYGVELRPRNAGWLLTRALSMYFANDPVQPKPTKRFNYISEHAILPKPIRSEYATEKKTGSFMNDQLKEEIVKNQAPAMVGTDIYKSGHFIVVFGWNEKEWLVHDPHTGKLNTKGKGGKACWYDMNKFRVRSICS